MLRSVYTKTLRDMRWGMLGWGGGVGILAVVTALGWSIAYPDEAARTQLAAQLRGGLSMAQVLYGPPGALDTLGGFIEWRVFGLGPVLLGIYAVLSATGVTRGAEESGALEVVVASPLTRSKVLLQQIAALGTAMVVVVVLVGLFVSTAGPITGDEGPRLLWTAASMANIGVATLMFGAFGLLAAQLAQRRRVAALVTIAVMSVSHIANTLPLVVPALRGIRYVSPLYLYTRSTPLSDGALDWAAVSAMLLVASALTALAWWASQRRDLFDSYHRRRPLLSEAAIEATAAPAGPAHPGLLLHNSFGRGLRDGLGTSLAWGAGLALFAVLLTGVTPNMRESLLQQSGPFARALERAGLTSERSILSVTLFSFLPVLATLIGVTSAAGWAGDELSQRLELELAAPVARSLVFIERLLAALGVQFIALLIVGAAMSAMILAAGIDVPLRSVAISLATLLAVTACVTAIGYAVASWRPGATAAAAGGFVAVAYFWALVMPLLSLPHWAQYLSIFGLYGSPLREGVVLWRIAVLLGATVLLAAAGAVRFQRRDIAK